MSADPHSVTPDAPRANNSGPPVRCSASRAYLFLKRVIDFLASLVALLLLGIPLLLLALLVRLASPGPAFFRQTRAGRNGRPFTMLKFRTMRTDANPYGDSPRTGDDPRITGIGRFLRESSLDELPQLVNVLRGDMSLVGPRPLYVQQAAEWNERQRGRLLVKPGLTGLAQISGRGSLTIEEKLELDVRYVETISLKTDLWIIWRTLTGLFRRGDIYEKRYSQSQKRRGAEEPALKESDEKRADEEQSGDE